MLQALGLLSSRATFTYGAVCALLAAAVRVARLRLGTDGGLEG